MHIAERMHLTLSNHCKTHQYICSNFGHFSYKLLDLIYVFEVDGYTANFYSVRSERKMYVFLVFIEQKCIFVVKTRLLCAWKVTGKKKVGSFILKSGNGQIQFMSFIMPFNDKFSFWKSSKHACSILHFCTAHLYAQFSKPSFSFFSCTKIWLIAPLLSESSCNSSCC